MKKYERPENGLPVSISLQPTLEAENITPQLSVHKRRLFTVSLFSILVAIVISFIAKFLIYLINLVTNLSFYGQWSITHSTPLNNSLGIGVIIVPVLGGFVVGLMALYGSKAIRGHGIPEAMEQILPTKVRSNQRLLI